MAARNMINPTAPYWVFLHGHERAMIREALAQFGGRVGATAAALGVSPDLLRRRIRELGDIDWRDYRRPAAEQPDT